MGRLGNREPQYLSARQPFGFSQYPLDDNPRWATTSFDVLNRVRRNLTLGATCYRIKGKYGQALKFVEAATSQAYNTAFAGPISNELTLSCWVWVDRTGTQYNEWICLYDATNTLVAELVSADDRRWYTFKVVIGGAGVNAYAWNLLQDPNTCNRWVHLAGVKNSNHMSIFVDGLLYETATNAGNMTAPTQLYLGTDRTGANRAKGYIDDVRIYFRALTRQEIHNIRYAGLSLGTQIPHPQLFSEGASGSMPY